MTAGSCSVAINPRRAVREERLQMLGDHLMQRPVLGVSQATWAPPTQVWACIRLAQLERAVEPPEATVADSTGA